MGLLSDMFNSEDGRIGLGLLAAGGPTTDPNQAGLGARLQNAVGSVDQWKKQQAQAAQVKQQMEMMQQYKQAQMAELQAHADQRQAMADQRDQAAAQSKVMSDGQADLTARVARGDLNGDDGKLDTGKLVKAMLQNPAYQKHAVEFLGKQSEGADTRASKEKIASDAAAARLEAARRHDETLRALKSVGGGVANTVAQQRLDWQKEQADEKKKKVMGDISQTRDDSLAGLDRLQEIYTTLGKNGGMTSENAGGITNALAAAGNAMPGVSRILGDRNQALRDEAASLIAGLTPTIGRSFGLTSQMMNSDADMRRLKEMMTNTGFSVEGATKALANLRARVNKGANGSSGGSPAPAVPSGWVLHTDAKGNKAYVSPDGKQFMEVN